MMTKTFATGCTEVVIEPSQRDTGAYFVAAIRFKLGDTWRTVLKGEEGREFDTSLGSVNAVLLHSARNDRGDWQISLSGKHPDGAWDATETITIFAGQPMVRREKTFRFLTPCEGAVASSFFVLDGEDIRYTFPLRTYDTRFKDTPAIRADVNWALPLPFHVWHGDGWVAIYGLDKRQSQGTLDYQPPARHQAARLGVYYPDAVAQPEDMAQQMYRLPLSPSTAQFEAGESVSLVEVIAFSPLAPGEEPLLRGEKLAAEILLADAPARIGVKAVADGIADFYPRCELWRPNAFGEGHGWFSNMWVFTQGGEPRNTGFMSGYFDLGWGEGIAVEIVTALTRHWRRTGRTDLLTYVDEITRNMARFRRSGDDEGAAAYYDRSNGQAFFDFNGHDHIWTHSLGHIGAQLIQAYIDNPAYPRPEIRAEWLKVAASCAAFLAQQQRENGDVPDLLDRDNHDINTTNRRAAARAVICGLWTALAQITNKRSYLDRALRLAHAVAPEIEAYTFNNQMIDAQTAPCAVTDGESAFYVLEGLVPLYEATKDEMVLHLCERAAAFGISWIYFFDVPRAYRGIARGGQVCRMPDFPLLFPGGTAKGVEPLLRLSKATGDRFYEQMAGEMVVFISNYQIDQPDKPWHGGIVHAMDQSAGKHWGPGKLGQVDSGMSTGNSLAALEYWLLTSHIA
ncbi:MAG: hypothetical protein KatS3mg053_3893 [Candidatus Roseilinea sp.]|nr:MAG: hypothetical protein KatS3mg053_3893 [Candidatus Roseilinea sp.]